MRKALGVILIFLTSVLIMQPRVAVYAVTTTVNVTLNLTVTDLSDNGSAPTEFVLVARDRAGQEVVVHADGGVYSVPLLRNDLAFPWVRAVEKDGSLGPWVVETQQGGPTLFTWSSRPTWTSSPVTPSIAAAATDRACTSSPTLVRSSNTGASHNCWIGRAGQPYSVTHDHL